MSASADPGTVVRRVPSLAFAVLAIGCGRIDTQVGAELPFGAAMPPYDAGAQDAAAPESSTTDGEQDSPVCKGDLSNIGLGDFHVSLTLTTAQTDNLVALVNQRDNCGPAVLWDIRMNGGLLYVETDDVTHYMELVSTGAMVNDGRPHAIEVRRASGQVDVSVDGTPSGSGVSHSSLGALAPVRIGTDICDGQLEPNGVDRTTALVGTIANVCVSAL
jgi:Laminin G domain